ncbi:hypothetical protein DLP05_019 [Stenotrophomonas phage vB_SmaS_DLP_5]|uniref:F5/8 type C domain-containing protein n=1 Tax=Stenotrophomonas phage vB_SmaS_DLP_5 TaxID=2044561 RepID=A0A2D2W2B4_9CAUD|nr:hypothetical protein FDJ07_gp018 [Stenotrophomonas phage vB_SmaS_DLP_5]ATS92277.1 hypothetical protein DLP05_019 [Stenotrophomonas phage vB_SmaS_DLP_5]
MSVIKGTANGHYDFLNQLQAILCDAGHAWNKSYTGTGNGRITGMNEESGGYVGGPDSIAETFTITATSPTQFSVEGSVSGVIGTTAVNVAFNHAKLKFRIVPGTTAFVAGDKFILNTTPKWQLVRRIGTRGSAYRPSDMVNSQNLWSTDQEYASKPAAQLPAHAGIQLIKEEVVGQFVIRAYNGSGNFTPKSFDLQYSDDGVNYTTAQSWADVVIASNEAKAFDVTEAVTPHLYWRLRFKTTAVDNVEVRVAALEFRRSAGDTFTISGGAEVLFKAPGLGGLESILVGCELYESVSSAVYNLNWYAPRNFDDKKRLRNMLPSSGFVGTPMTNQSFNFWVFVNGQRVIIVCRIGSVYIGGYFGFGNPYEIQTNHQYPMILGGCTDEEATRFDTTNAENRIYCNPGRWTLRAFYPASGWVRHANLREVGNNVAAGSGVEDGKVFPAAMVGSGDVRYLYRDNVDGSLPMFPSVIGGANPRHMWGEFDGVYWTTGFNNLPEAIITREGFDHMVFQDMFRTTYQDYYAVRMD